MNIVIRTPKTKEDFKAYYHLRYIVLREPIGQPKGTEKDDYEPISEHYMAVDADNGEILGVAKVFEKEPGVMQLSHMAVNVKYQKSGIGKLLVEHGEALGRQRGMRTMGVLTRANATEFYEKCGYRVVGIAGTLFGKLQLLWLEKPLV